MQNHITAIPKEAEVTSAVHVVYVVTAIYLTRVRKTIFSVFSLLLIVLSTGL